MVATDLWVNIPPPSNIDSETKWAYIKYYIDVQLLNCAWTQLPDNGLTPAEQATWLTYRETLQNIPFAFADPDDVVFPDPPVISQSAPTPAQLASRARRKAAVISARAIPDWALWTPTDALTWGNTNIGTPLINARSSLPATLTLATARAAFVVILNILDKMWILQNANAQMTLALRDAQFPDLPER